jgi:hypothetical protein
MAIRGHRIEAAALANTLRVVLAQVVRFSLGRVCQHGVRTVDVRHSLYRVFRGGVFVWVVMLGKTSVGGPDHSIAGVWADLQHFLKGFHGAPM